MSVGAAPVGGVAAANSLPQASFAARVAQPASTSASVAKFAIVGVWLLFSGPWIASPQPPVPRSTKLGTLPAAMLRLRAGPLIAVPSRNCAWVQTDATVVISLTTTLLGGALPSTDNRAIAGLSPAPLLTAGMPPFATRYRMVSAPVVS